MAEETLATPPVPQTGEESTNDLEHAGHARQLVAMYAADEWACAARDRLLADGVPAEDIHLVDARAVCEARSREEEARVGGLWGAIKHLFAPGEADAPGYVEGVRRGCVMLLVRTRPEQQRHVMEALESTEPIDVGAQMAEWRASPVPDEAGASGAGALGAVDPAGEPTTAGSGTAEAGAAEDVISLVEERMRVGKREVERGTVRVRSYVVERPVQAQVTLREERLRVDRRSVERPVSAAGEEAFRECVVEVSAIGEEAVVSKEMRVVEEVEIRKEAIERVQTVSDTVRRTEVVVEGGPEPAEAGRLAGRGNSPER
jgi:uncharacterized protein (TIGR02271 family)